MVLSGLGYPLGLPRSAFAGFTSTGLASMYPVWGSSGLNLGWPDRDQWLPQTPGSRPACDTGRQHLSAKLLWKPSGDFTDSDSDDFEEAEGRYFRVRWEKPPGEGGSGSCSYPGLSSSSSVNSHAAQTSSSSSAACSARHSRLLLRLPPSSTRDSCRILVRPSLRGGRGLRVGASPVCSPGSWTPLSCRVGLRGAAVPVLTGHCPGGRVLR